MAKKARVDHDLTQMQACDLILQYHAAGGERMPDKQQLKKFRGEFTKARIRIAFER